MLINEAKSRIESEINKVPAMFEGINVKTVCDVQDTTNETDEGTETVFLFGAVSFFTENMSDEDTLIIPIEADFDSLGNVDEAALEEKIENFKERVLNVRDRLIKAENIEEEIKKLGLEVDAKLEAEFKARIDKLNESTKNNLMIAGVAAALLLVFAAICILVGKIF